MLSAMKIKYVLNWSTGGTYEVNLPIITFRSSNANVLHYGIYMNMFTIWKRKQSYFEIHFSPHFMYDS